jgi:hypothetical protein
MNIYSGREPAKSKRKAGANTAFKTGIDGADRHESGIAGIRPPGLCWAHFSPDRHPWEI